MSGLLQYILCPVALPSASLVSPTYRANSAYLITPFTYTDLYSHALSKIVFFKLCLTKLLLVLITSKGGNKV